MGSPAFTRRRFTTDEVYRMVEAGVLDAHDPVELIDGELIEMSPQGPRHSRRIVRIRGLLEAAFGEGHHVQDHSPIDAGPDSLPEPDVAVVRGPIDAFDDHHPRGVDLALAVEISVTSHAADRAKALVYARARVPVYWHVDLIAERLVVYREPRDDGYALVRTFTPSEQVPAGEGAIPVARLVS